jgi:hypothetical protein
MRIQGELLDDLALLVCIGGGVEKDIQTLAALGRNDGNPLKLRMRPS